MPLIEGLDLSAVEVSEYTPLPAGDYEVRVASASIEDTKNPKPDDPMPKYIKVEFRVVDNEDETLIGRIIFDNFSLKSQALFKLKGFMEAAGLDSDGGIDTDEFIGAEVRARCAARTLPKRPEDAEPKVVLDVKKYYPVA